MNIRSHVVMAIAVSVPFVLGYSVSSVRGAQDSQDAMKAMTEVNQKIMQSMQGMKFTGDADKDFVMMMIPHHQGAIDVAQVQLKYGKEMELRKMAEAIIKAQQKEIEEMKKWQQSHGM